MRDRIQVILPARDEAATVGNVVAALRACGFTRIRVVDNGSRDATAALAAAAGAEVIHEPRPGYGQACWRGYQDLDPAVEWLLFCDADGSDDPADLDRLLAPAHLTSRTTRTTRPARDPGNAPARPSEEQPSCHFIGDKLRAPFPGECHLLSDMMAVEESAETNDDGRGSPGVDFVLGDRRARASGRAVMTPVQHFGNGLATTLMRWGWGQRYGDLGPLRLIRRDLLERIGMRDRGFGWTIEMQVRAVEEGARIVELPVNYRPRQGGRSKISGTIKGSVQAGTIILTTLAALGVRRAAATARHQKSDTTARLGGALLVLGALAMAPWGDFAAPGNVRWFLVAAAVMAAGFVWSWRVAAVSAVWFWAVAIGARLALLPMFPGDDVWRYGWEGRMQVAGFSPYLHAPLDPVLAGLRNAEWTLINHPEHSAIYPPVMQLVFHGLAAIGGGVTALKLLFIAAELAATALLARRFGRGATLVFAWNPLVIYSGAGGAHFESLFLLALVVGWLAWERRRDSATAWLGLGLSVGLKWVPAPIVAWMAWHERATLARAARGLAWAALPLGVGLAWFHLRYGRVGPLMPGDFVEVARGMDVLPWLVSLVSPASLGSNAWVALAFAPVAGMILLRARSWVTMAEAYFIALLLFSPSNHAWYFTWLMPLAVATRHLGSRWLAVSGLAYFWVWDGVAHGGGWQQSGWDRALVWLPFFAGWAWQTWRSPRRAGGGP
jgi:glycosyltransferase involved in cell wall biosynthesis